MATVVEPIGVHLVDANEPCHLVELVVRGCTGEFDIGDFTQPIGGRPRNDWQVPWDEKILEQDGTAIAADAWDIRGQKSPWWVGDVRLAFFFHYLDANRPLNTPFGTVELPAETPRPDRLHFMEYESP